MADLITVYWRDIPAQVIVKKGRKRSKVLLSERFQKAIDRAAMRAGKSNSDAYLEDWRRESIVCDQSDIDKMAKELAESHEAFFSDEVLDNVVKNLGISLK